MSNNVMIEIKNLSAGYGPRDVLRGINASANKGEFIALIGPNGSGKSTLIKTVAGLIKPSTGGVELNNKSVRTMPLKQRARSLAYLAQSREAAPSMTVAEVIRLGRAPYRGALGKISGDGEAAINSAISRAQIQPFLERRFDGLSGGEQARVLLARALVVGAPTLLADEPTAALDPYYQLSMMQMLKDETRSGTLVIAALHDLALARQFADRIWVMDKGQLAADDTPDAALSADTLKSVFGIKAPKGGFQSLEFI